MPSACAASAGPCACCAATRAFVTASNVSRSCAAYPFTDSTRFGIRSQRRLSCTSTCAQALSTRLRAVTSRLYSPITKMTSRTSRTRTTMTTQVTGSTLSASREEDHVLLAVVRAAVEPAVQRFDVEVRFVEEPEPFGCGEPVQPEGGGGTVGAHGQREGPRLLVPVGSLEDPGLAFEPAPVRLVDVLAARCEDVEHEVAVRIEKSVRGAEGTQLLRLRLHVQERTERADHERNALRN